MPGIKVEEAVLETQQQFKNMNLAELEERAKLKLLTNEAQKLQQKIDGISNELLHVEELESKLHSLTRHW